MNQVVTHSVNPVPTVDLAAALALQPEAEAAFAKLPPSHQREYLKWIEEARKPQTRQRRIEKTIEGLLENQKPNGTQPPAQRS